MPVEQISEAAILAITHLTVELDDVHFPVHRKSHKERERWQGLLQRQIPYRLASAILEGDEATARAKKTASVLMWVAGNELRIPPACIVEDSAERDRSMHARECRWSCDT